MTGQVLDRQGNPMAGVTVVFKLEGYGNAYEVKTDDEGKFTHAGLRLGVYNFSVLNPTGRTLVEGFRWRLTMSEEPVVIDFREFVPKEDPEAAARRKKAEEEAVKFENMKEHFDLGLAAFNEAKLLQDEIQRTPADQRGPKQEKLAQLQQTAITEYQAAEKAAPEKDPNVHKVLANLAQSYEMAEEYEKAAGAWSKAITLRSTEAGYYMGWGTSLARLGKVDQAGAACDQAAAIEKGISATCWRNVGIILYNTNRLNEAVGPLQKATELDPKNADAWYLLAASLLAAMDFKKEGDKLIPVVQPGTAEAYQKYLELAPNGRFAADAKAGLATLEQMGAGIETKVKTRKKG